MAPLLRERGFPKQRNTLTSSYSYPDIDAVGNRLRMDYADGSYITYAYDEIYRLTRESKFSGGSALYRHGWDYDPMGNRQHLLTSSDGTTWTASDYYHYNTSNNQLTDYGPIDTQNSLSNTRFTYDGWGNTYTKIVPGVGTTTYSYDGRNQMSGITYPNSSTNGFSYNAYGLRSQKVDSAGTKNYLYSGMAVIDESGTIYTWGAMGLSSMVRGSSTYWYLIDGLGSVRQVADAATGNVVKGYDYDAWGSVAAQSGTLANPYQYLGSLGYYTDPDSGLLNVGYRQYNPAVGRWMTEDPIGLRGGTNLYAYCDSNPTALTDPNGTLSLPNPIDWIKNWLRRNARLKALKKLYEQCKKQFCSYPGNSNRDICKKHNGPDPIDDCQSDCEIGQICCTAVYGASGGCDTAYKSCLTSCLGCPKPGGSGRSGGNGGSGGIGDPTTSALR